MSVRDWKHNSILAQSKFLKTLLKGMAQCAKCQRDYVVELDYAVLQYLHASEKDKAKMAENLRAVYNSDYLEKITEQFRIFGNDIYNTLLTNADYISIGIFGNHMMKWDCE